MKEFLLKIKKKYIEISLPAKASIWYVFCNIVQKGIFLLTTPVFTRLLTTEEYGVYSVYQSWYGILTIFATLYLYSGVYNNGLIKYPENKDQFTSSMMGLTTLCTCVFVILYFVNSKYWNSLLDLSTGLVLAIFIQSISVAAFTFWAKEERFAYRYKALVAVTLLMAILSSLLGIIWILNTEKFKAEARVWAFVIVQAIVGLFFYCKIIFRGKKLFNLKFWKFALFFSLPLVPHYLSQIVLNHSDRIMISNMVGKSEAGIYSIAYMIGSMMTIITQAINDSLIPYTYQCLKNKEEDKLKMIATDCVLLVAVGCVMAMLFAPEIVHIFTSKPYYAAIEIIPSVAAAVFFTFLYTLYGNIEFYFEKTKFVMVASCMAAVLNISLNWLLIPVFGYYAAGYTTLISYIIYSIMHRAFSRKICKKNLACNSVYNEKIIIGLAIFVLVSAFVISITYSYFLLRISIIILLTIILIIKRKLFVKLFLQLKK